jgi:hypothetical protein
VGLTGADLTGPLRFVGAFAAPRFELTVGAFAGALGLGGRPPTARSSGEVAHVFWIPRSAVGRTQRVHRETGYGLTEVNATVHEGHVLWGFTRRVLRDFFGYPVEDIVAGPLFARRGERPT